MYNAGVWMGILIFGWAGTCFYQSLSYGYYGKYGPGPGLLPMWIFGLLMLLSLGFIVDSVKQKVSSIKDLLPKGNGLKQVISIFVSVTIFIIAAPHTGFSIASVFMLVILLAPAYKWYLNLCISVLTTAIIFYVFDKLLSVPLPVNSMGF